MVYECKPTGEISEIIRLKKELTTAIETDTITWKEWDYIPKVLRKTNKLNNPYSTNYKHWRRFSYMGLVYCWNSNCFCYCKFINETLTTPTTSSPRFTYCC